MDKEITPYVNSTIPTSFPIEYAWVFKLSNAANPD